jgi:3-hydroxybutyryl-CoA dehydratase
MKSFIFKQLKKGQKASFNHSFTAADIKKFGKLSGDLNPLHLKAGYAQKMGFSSRLVHGHLAASLFSQLVGMHLPGKYALFLGQQLNFRRPIKAGDKLIVSGKIINKITALKIIEVATKITDKNKKVLVDGVAKVKLFI